MKELQNKVKQLFEENKVDLVIGWQKGSLPMTSTPVFIDDIKDVDKLIFDVTCQNNLAVYLTKDKRKISADGKKIGVLAKGCDARSLVLHCVENQINRENLVIIGVPCKGVIDKNKMMKTTGNKEMTEFTVEGKQITLKGRDFTMTVNKYEIASDACQSCAYPDAPVFDEFVTEPRKENPKVDEFSKIETFEKLSLDKRWDKMVEEYSKCIRCYACRNVCPSCYCNTCFVDQNDPQWIGKSPEISDTIIFHLIRNLHIAGRCVECGACARACPEGIDLLMMNKKITKELKERFDYTVGIDINEKPAMQSYRENEKQDFIMG